MKTLLPEMKELLEMSLNGASFNDLVESSPYNFLELYAGSQIALTWLEMYIELTDDEEKRELLKLPLFKEEENE